MNVNKTRITCVDSEPTVNCTHSTLSCKICTRKVSLGRNATSQVPVSKVDQKASEFVKKYLSHADETLPRIVEPSLNRMHFRWTSNKWSDNIDNF